MRLHPVLALAVASLGGCAVFVLLLPWGDPCSTRYAGAPCPILMSAAQANLRNASFVLICITIGFGAGWLSRSHRLLMGTLSVPLAGFLAAVWAHVLYRPGTSLFDSGAPRAYTLAVMDIGGVLLLGALGAVASMWLRRPSSAASFKPRPHRGS